MASKESTEFLYSLYCLIHNEIQPLAALIADSFAKFNDKGYDKDKEGSSFLKRLGETKEEKYIKKMIINTRKQFFDEPGTKRETIKNTLNVWDVDCQILLNLMKQTTFLNLQYKKGKCQRLNTEKCCPDCDHDGTKEKRCKHCPAIESECGMICCLSCNSSVTWQNNEMERVKDSLKGTKSLIDVIKHSKICWVFALKNSFEVLLKCRNLVSHETKNKVEQFFKKGSGEIGNFKDIKNLDHLCREIYFAANTLTLALSKSTFFDDDENVKSEAEKKQKKIEKCFDISSRLRLEDFKKEMYDAYIKACDTYIDNKIEEKFANMKIIGGTF